MTVMQSTEEVWLTFQHRLHTFLLTRAPVSDVDDIQQDVFLRIHRSLKSGEAPRNLNAWVYQIARNVLIDHHRKRKVTRPLLPEEGGVTEEDFSIELEEDIIHKLSRCLRPFVDDLPEPYKSALIWTTYENMSQVEAAQRAGISTSGMKSRIQRGRKLLVKKFTSCCALQFDVRGAPMDCNC